MSKSQTVGIMSAWSGVIRDMFRQFEDGSLTLEHTKAFVEHRNPFPISDIRVGLGLDLGDAIDCLRARQAVSN